MFGNRHETEAQIPKNSKLKKLIWIAFIFPPYGGTQGLRQMKYVRHIIEKLHSKVEIDVLTIIPTTGFPQLDRPLENQLKGCNITIHRVSPGFAHYLRYGRMSRNGKNGPIVDLLSNTILFLSNMLWVFPAIFLLGKMRIWDRKNYDAIYTFVDPFSSLIVGAVAKFIFGARWAVEYGDPWLIKPATLGKSRLSRSIGSMIEKRLLQLPNCIITRLKSISEIYAETYGIPTNKFMEIYGGIEWSDYDAPLSASNLEGLCFSIYHSGKFYDDSVDPEPFFHALRVLLDSGMVFRAVFMGEKSDLVDGLIAKYELSECVETPGHRPYEEVISFQRSASLLVAFGCKTIYKIPSKIAQYIASSRPILLIKELDDDPGGKLLESTKTGICVPNNMEVIKDTISDIYNKWQNQRLHDEFTFSKLESISFDSISMRIAQALGLVV